MKSKEKQLARKLREEGLSINEITNSLNTSKSSVSLWVRDIELTKSQREKLSKKGFRIDVIEKRRKVRLENEKAKRQIIIDKASKEIKKISKKNLFLIGIALYWAEGGKTERGLVRLSNGDPEVIKIAMNFFRNVCDVPEEKFRGYIHIHPHLDVRRAERYWSDVSRIPLKQFFKTYCKPNKSSQNKKDSLPFGTFDIYICNTELFLKIQGWTKAIIKHAAVAQW